MDGRQREPPVRLAELLAALSLAMDLGLGQPSEHVLRTCVLSLRLARSAGASREELTETYYVALLRFLGCTADSHETAASVGGDDLAFRRRMAPLVMGDPGALLAALRECTGPVGQVEEGPVVVAPGDAFRAHCEVAVMLAGRMGCPATVCHGLRHAFERWDGQGYPAGLAGPEVPFSVRVVALARDVALLVSGAAGDAGDILRERRGRAHDPELVDLVLREWRSWFATPADGTLWEQVLAVEPEPPLTVGDVDLERILGVFADFADLKVPFTLGHSVGVARLAEAAGRWLGLSEVEVIELRRAGLVHDLGRVGVPNGIWEKAGALGAGEWERVRLHPYLTERILVRSPSLAPLAALAGAHHERLDGSGYHRGSGAAQLPGAARVLAAADAFQAMTQPRPHRNALSPARAAMELKAEVRAGRLDRDATDAVLSAGGQLRAGAPPARRTRLTGRETEVLRLLCRGLPNREVARRLGITPKTVGHHVQNIYGKIGVSTRAGAAVYAMERGLLHD